MRNHTLRALLAGALAAAPLCAQQTIAGCQILPTNNVWNTPVDLLPALADSAARIQYTNTHCTGVGCVPRTTLKADFGSGLWEGAPIGIPYVAVPNGQTMLPIDFDSLGGWPEESDPGPYPIPPGAPIEGGPSSDGDRHVLVVRQGSCILYELYHSWPEGQNGCAVPGSPPGWCGLSGAVYTLASNALRPDGWTSADAAGLPILPGLARFPEVAAGEIRHALRFTVEVTRETYIWPARHEAGSTMDALAPPMGLRLRLRNSFDVTPFSPQARAVLSALKKYGMILADNGSNWFISGIPDPGWNNDVLQQLAAVPGTAFEVVDVSSLRLDPDSGATPQPVSTAFR